MFAKPISTYVTTRSWKDLTNRLIVNYTFLLFILFLFFSSIIHSQTIPTQDVSVGMSDPSAVARYGDWLYVAEAGPNNRIVKVDVTAPALPTNAIAVTTNVGICKGLTVHGDYLYYSQNAWNQVSRIDLTVANPVPEVVAAGITSPTGLAIQGNNLYVSNTSRVSKIDLLSPFPVNNPITVVDQMSSPWGLAISGTYLYIVESGDAEIVRINLNDSYPAPTTMITTAGLTAPRNIIIVENDMYITEEFGNQVSVIDLSFAPPLTPEPFLTQLNNPMGITYDDSDIYISEIGQDKTYKIINLTEVIVENGGTGTGNLGSGTPQQGCGLSFKLWIGRYSGNPIFHDPDNWYPEGIPGSCDIVVVTNGGLYINSPHASTLIRP